jgi:hypothetical protein
MLGSPCQCVKVLAYTDYWAVTFRNVIILQLLTCYTGRSRADGLGLLDMIRVLGA